MEPGTLVFAYFWWHHSVPFDVFTAKKDDRSGWQLKQWCNAPVVLKDLTVKMVGGKLIETAIVARPDHPDIQVEVCAELLSVTERQVEPFPMWQVGAGDVVVLKMGTYERWYYPVAAKHPFVLKDGKYKVYSRAIDAWRSKHHPEVIYQVPKFVVKTIAFDATHACEMAIVFECGKDFASDLYKIPVNCFEVLEKRHVR